MANLQSSNGKAANLILSLADLKREKIKLKKENQTSTHFFETH